MCACVRLRPFVCARERVGREASGQRTFIDSHVAAICFARLHIAEMESKENKKRAISDGGNINYEAVVLDIEGTTTPISFVKVRYNSYCLWRDRPCEGSL